MAIAATGAVVLAAFAGSRLLPDAVVTATPAATPTFSLFAEGSATPAPSAAESTAPSPTPRKTSAAALPTATPEPGIVGVNSDPAGEIFIDGVATKRETPAFDLVVPAGRHEIRIVNPVSRLEARFFVDVAPGSRTAHPKVTLAPP